MGITLHELGKLDEAATSYRQAISKHSGFAEAHNNLGNVLQELECWDDSQASYTRAIKLKSDYATAYYNLGITLQHLGRLDEAQDKYKKAIILMPNYPEAQTNLGNTVKNLGGLVEAGTNFRRVITLEPNNSEASNNLAITLQELGCLDESIGSYRKAIVFNPAHTNAYLNLGFLMQESGNSTEYILISEFMLKSRSEPLSTKKRAPVVALVPFGRSGSLFLHSLIDGHPEIATLPGVYFKGWFGTELWQKLAPDLSSADWRERLATNVLEELEPLFDANCRKNVIGEPMRNTNWLAHDLGFTNMGSDGSQSLSLDQNAFYRNFLNLLKPLPLLNISECFELIHQAFEVSVRDQNEVISSNKKCIFYHIHNPNSYERLHFLKHYPEAYFLHLIRNPLQSMESWIISNANNLIINNTHKKMSINLLMNEWRTIVNKVIVMFRQILFPFHQASNQFGIRLEDIKRNPKEMMPKLASWMGVNDHAELYKSSFCGLQYWGPPSPTGSITGFDTKAIDTPVGRFLGARDTIIFETLFWPLSKKYAYTDMDEAAFHLRLAEIRPWLDEPLEFEIRLYEQTGDHNSPIEALDPYIRLHQFMRLLWERLNRDEMYMGIPQPLMLK